MVWLYRQTIYTVAMATPSLGQPPRIARQCSSPVLNFSALLPPPREADGSSLLDAALCSTEKDGGALEEAREQGAPPRQRAATLTGCSVAQTVAHFSNYMFGATTLSLPYMLRCGGWAALGCMAAVAGISLVTGQCVREL